MRKLREGNDMYKFSQKKAQDIVPKLLGSFDPSEARRSVRCGKTKIASYSVAAVIVGVAVYGVFSGLLGYTLLAVPLFIGWYSINEEL